MDNRLPESYMSLKKTLYKEMHFAKKIENFYNINNYVLANYEKIKQSNLEELDKCYSYILEHKHDMQDDILYLVCVAIIKAFKRKADAKLVNAKLDNIRNLCNTSIRNIDSCNKVFEEFGLSEKYIPLNFGMSRKIVITFGTFDLFHLGHLRILQRARSLGNVLIVGVSSDKLNWDKKEKKAIYSYEERKEIVQNLKCVDFVFEEESLEKKAEYLTKYHANVFVMGDDWKDKFDYLKPICDVQYFPRTPTISTTNIVEHIRNS
jgi:choline-phosphate cytidylyltransferase